MRKVLYFDTETTGITANSAIVQIAGIIEINGEVMEEFNIKCKPHIGADINEKALEVTRLTLEKINSYQEPVDGMLELESILGKYCDKYNSRDKFIPAGHNVKFDLDMLRNFFERQGNKYLGSWLNFKMVFDTLPAVQLLQIANVFPEFPNNKLGTLCEHFNISLGDNAHDALADIRATRELALIILSNLKKDK